MNIQKKGKKKGKKPDWSMFESQEFWDYVDEYAEFIKKHIKQIDQYINVDVIKNPEMTWKVQKHLEKKHKLKPLPVIHYGTSVDWLNRYLDAGYKYIGIGMGGQIRNKEPYYRWADGIWNVICDTPDRLPRIKVHGFAITTHQQMVRYPWYSVDSVTWKKMSYYGQILIPPLRSGDFCFTVPNQIIFIDEVSPYTARKGDQKGRHFKHLSRTGQKIVLKWLERIGTPFGKTGRKGKIIEPGVSNDCHYRCQATIRYFEELRKHLPTWPWPFHATERPKLLEVIRK